MAQSARNIDNLSPSEKRKIDINSTIGVNGSYMPESFSIYDRAPGESVYENKNNALIVLGRDRPGNKLSGYQGAGNTSCGAISLIVGRPSDYGYSGQDFEKNAATLYISQKTDVDRNFNLSPGEMGLSSVESAITAKADAIRLVSRGGIKLVTGTDSKYPTGDEVRETLGIELNAGNQGGFTMVGGKEVKAIQPIPRGDNLVSMLEEMSKTIDAVCKLVGEFIDHQEVLNKAIASHTHVVATPVGPGNATPSIEIQTVKPSVKALIAQFPKNEISTTRNNISINSTNYLTPSHPLYINSRQNKTT